MVQALLLSYILIGCYFVYKNDDSKINYELYRVVKIKKGNKETVKKEKVNLKDIFKKIFLWPNKFCK